MRQRSRRRLSIGGGLAMVLAVLTPSAGATLTQEGVTAFTRVHVLPMTGEGALESQTVVVRDGVISEIGSERSVRAPEGARVVDGEGRYYLIPGLAEMHAHVPPTITPPRDLIEDYFFLYLANGVTTIRGMLGAGYQIELADEVEAGETMGPTFYVGAPSLNGRTAPNPETAIRLVEDYAEAGYDFLKIHPGIGLDTWDALMGAARKTGITVAGHVPADVGLMHALESGHICVDHLDGYLEAVMPPELGRRLSQGEDVPLEEVRRAIDDQAIDALVTATLEADAYVVPTMYLWDNLYTAQDPSDFLDLPEMRYVSRTQRDAWAQQGQGASRTPAALSRAMKDTRRRILKALYEGGAKILMGTDSPQLYNVPGFALHRELRIYEDAGMSRVDILRSGTVEVARYVEEVLGLDGDFGMVAPGMRADLLLLRGNPADDLSFLTNPLGAMARGRWLSEDEIQKGLEELANRHAGN